MPSAADPDPEYTIAEINAGINQALAEGKQHIIPALVMLLAAQDEAEASRARQRLGWEVE